MKKKIMWIFIVKHFARHTNCALEPNNRKRIETEHSASQNYIKFIRKYFYMIRKEECWVRVGGLELKAPNIYVQNLLIYTQWWYNFLSSTWNKPSKWRRIYFETFCFFMFLGFSFFSQNKILIKTILRVGKTKKYLITCVNKSWRRLSLVRWIFSGKIQTNIEIYLGVN